MKKFPREGWAAAGILLTLALVPVFNRLPPLVACTDKTAQSLVLALCAGMGLYLLAGGRNLWLGAGTVSTLLLVLWLGVYPLSPRYRNVLQGFTVTAQGRGSVRIADGAMVTLAAGQPAALGPLTALNDVHCNWMSAQGGDFDDPQGCDTVYIPPHASSYAILKVNIQSACLPRTLGQIKISILP